MARPTVALIPRGALATVVAVVVRPDLWRAALRQLRILVPTRWWAKRPFLPVPDRDWMAFRMTTAYGDPGAPLVADDVVTWLRWSKSTGSTAGVEG
ncbi:hypothetical protein [Actinospongicola halichondriae]|uniref:hypothetical protein n=1 Tax=Actinospongicola halichondriae TaxID=3236844 RepID=UPI003D4797FE